MNFRYLRDPLFLACVLVYAVHHIAARSGWSTPWLRAYLNDLVCIPFWVPPMVWLTRHLGLRGHDRVPVAHEIVIPLIVWSVTFEILLPSLAGWDQLTYADPYDVLCYTVGAALASGWWKFYYAGQPASCASE